MGKPCHRIISYVMKKMKRLVMILSMGLFCMSNVSYAGNGDLTVGGTLEMTGSANGFLPPRMTTSARGNLSPSPGMLIYNTDDNAYNYYTSSGWKAIPASLPVHDNTGASVDYALAVGETAKITYASATSIPLHIATSEGIYELLIACKSLASSPTNGNLFLQPNNTTYTGAINEQHVDPAGSTITTGACTNNAFDVGYAGLIQYRHQISTFTLSKSMISNGLFKYNSGTFEAHVTTQYWNDTTTVWSSLGIITLPYAQSGTIIIRRLL